MRELARFLFTDHWVLSTLLLPWLEGVWAALHFEWWRLAAVLLYLELVGGPVPLLK